MNNVEIRQTIKDKRIYYWEVAKELGIASETLSRWLRVELDADRKKMIMDAVHRIKY